jgi:hypothetical protein
MYSHVYCPLGTSNTRCLGQTILTWYRARVSSLPAAAERLRAGHLPARVTPAPTARTCVPAPAASARTCVPAPAASAPPSEPPTLPLARASRRPAWQPVLRTPLPPARDRLPPGPLASLSLCFALHSPCAALSLCGPLPRVPLPFPLVALCAQIRSSGRGQKFCFPHKARTPMQKSEVLVRGQKFRSSHNNS